LRLVGLVGVGVGDDGDVAQEVRFVGGIENKLYALDGDVGGDVELCERGGTWVRDGIGGGDHGVEGLGFAAGGDGCALNDGGVEMRERAAVEGAEVEEDVQMRDGGFLQGERGGAGEMALGEIEEGEGAEEFGGGVVGAGDFGGGEEVVGGEVEVDFAVGARGHVEVEGESVVVGDDVANGGGLGVGGLGFAVADDEGDFLRLGVGEDAEDAEVVGRGAGGVRVDAGVEYGAGDAGCVGRNGEGADVAKVLRVSERSGRGADGREGAGLEEGGKKRDEGFQAVASVLWPFADRCRRAFFPMA